MPETMPDRIAAEFAWAPLEAWASAAASATEYAARAIARKRSPLGIAEDLAEFARVATLREKPTWANDAREVRAWPIARLLDYSAPSATAARAHPGASAAGRPCVVDRRLRHGPEPDAHTARRRIGPPLRHRLAACDRRDRGLVDRGVRRRVGGGRAVARRAGESRRRLPGRLARGGLRRPAPRPGEHARDRRRTNRHPRRRVRNPGMDPTARPPQRTRRSTGRW